MGKHKSELKRSTSEGSVLLAVVPIPVADNFLSQFSNYFFHWCGAGIFAGFALWILYQIFFPSEKYINESGYVVLREKNELEHRYIAKRLMNRNLYRNEVVHHINGKKTENEVENLCLMDSQKHEHFHSWLAWKRRKSGRYPEIRFQKRVLVEEYGGILLEDVAKKIEDVRFSFIDRDTPVKVERESLQEIGPHLSKMLFEQLRKERKWLADDQGIPVYMIFDNNTLHGMVEALPDTLDQLSQVRGIGPMRLQRYGPNFISVIKKFKTDHKLKSRRNEDTA